MEPEHSKTPMKAARGRERTLTITPPLQPFDAVRKKYSDAHEYSYAETLSDGAKVTLHRTRVGNYGDFIISEQSRDAGPFRRAELPAEHVQPLLKGRAGDVIVLRDDAGQRSILYHIREVYTPSR